MHSDKLVLSAVCIIHRKKNSCLHHLTTVSIQCYNKKIAYFVNVYHDRMVVLITDKNTQFQMFEYWIVLSSKTFFFADEQLKSQNLQLLDVFKESDRVTTLTPVTLASICFLD